MINIPPRHTKSITVAVVWPAWHWAEVDPGSRWLFSCYHGPLAIRDNVRCRRLILSPWYQSRYGDQFQLVYDQNQKTRYETDRYGFRVATSVGGGGATGEGGDFVVVDDPHNVKERESETKRQATITWWDETMSTRLNDPKTGAHVVMGQRTHDKDLFGHLEEVGGYEILRIPTLYEPERSVVQVHGIRDPRTKQGELLNPERFGEEEVEEARRRLGRYGFAAQHQQRPSPAGGGIIPSADWSFWYPAEVTEIPTPVRGYTDEGELKNCRQVALPVGLWRKIIQSWDTAFKDLDTSSYVVGQVWAATGADRFLLDQFRGQVSYSKTKEGILVMREAWPKARTIVVEDKASGPMIIDELSKTITGIVPWPRKGQRMGSKENRAWAIQPAVESGNVFLPHPYFFPWVLEYLAEWEAFPTGDHNDQVDATTMALIELDTKRSRAAVAFGEAA